MQWRPQDVRPGSQSLWIGYLMWQNGLGRCEGVRDLETGGAPGLSGGPTSSQLSSSEGGQEYHSQRRREDGSRGEGDDRHRESDLKSLLLLKWRNGPQGSDHRQASEAVKGTETHSL